MNNYKNEARFLEQFLETIMKYKMTPAEAKAYKLCCLYQDSLVAVFPNYSLGREYNFYNKPKSDPRKYTLFKYCYKLIRETQHKLKDAEYVYYIRAQFDIINAIATKNQTEPYIDPNCLVGEKAWKRWLVWNRLFEKRKNAPLSSTQLQFSQDEEKVKGLLLKSKEFLKSKFENLTKEVILKSIQDRVLFRWVASHQMCEYYPLLSPILNSWLESSKLTLDSVFYIDFDHFKPHITPAIEEYFKNEFKYEFEPPIS